MANRKWTIIMQISGENNLIPDNIGIFNEFGIHGGSAEVTFVIILDGMSVEGDPPPGFSFLKKEFFAFPCVFRATRGMKISKKEPHKKFPDKENLASVENLAEVLNYIKEEFPAENYGYIYNGHGGPGTTDVSDEAFVAEVVKVKANERVGGEVDFDKVEARIRKESIVLDDEDWVLAYMFFLDEEEDRPEILMAIFSKGLEEEEEGEEEEILTLTYSAMSQVLQNVFGRRELSFVLLDCCWGMMLENVSIFQDASKFFIASPDEMSSLGIGYAKLCESILKRPGIRPEELAKMLVALYYTERYSDYEDPDDPENKVFFNMGVSLTCANTDEFEDKIFRKFRHLCDELVNGMENFAETLRAAIGACKDYTYANPQVYDMYNIDLVWLLENIIFQNDRSANRNERINELAFLLLRDLKIYLVSAYLSNNYPNANLGTRAIGGKGITITFPQRVEDYDDAILEETFFPFPPWRDMIKKFFDVISEQRLSAARLREAAPEEIEAIKKESLGDIVGVKSKWRLAKINESVRRRSFNR